VKPRPIALAAVCAFFTACGGSSSSSTSTTTTSPSPASTVQEVDIGGYSLDLECDGEGSPTVVFEAGAGADRTAFADRWTDLRDITRVCAYDRAGIGTSDERPEAASTTLGDLADELALVLEGGGIDEPVVLVSHSLGGGVAQFFADRYSERVAGLVFVDTVAVPGYVDWFGPEVDDGTGGPIDMRRTEDEWTRIGSLGRIPTIVLTQDFQGEDDVAPRRFRRYFRQVHQELAKRSSDGQHVIAVDSGHMIHETSPELVTTAITEVIEAVRSGERLAPCEDRIADLGGACA
jgi:pimeloyl-ACP methyl ester carboxylesterase